MAQFYANIQGNRGEATRMGTKASGLVSHTRGWDVGVKVRMIHRDGKDWAEVTLTSGSNGGPTKLLGTFGADSLADG